MDFGWSDSQLAYRDEIVAFAQSQLNVDTAQRDHASDFPHDLWCRCAEFGVQGVCVPEAFGGQGRDIMSGLLMMEALGYGCRDNGLTFALNAQMWSMQPTIANFASEDQKRRYLTPLAQGSQFAAYGMTEPGSGSDAFALQTRAQKSAEGYLLNGHKTLITFAPIANFAVIFATTDPALGKWGLSAFFVDQNTPGWRVSENKEKMGLRTVPIGDIILEDCFVPAENRLGPEGAGAAIFSDSQEWERAVILGSQLGAMQFQLEQAIARARERKQFGQAIGSFQTVSNRIVDMKVRLEMAQLISYKAAWLKSQGRPMMQEAAMAKLVVSEAFVDSSLDAIRVHGGAGYLTENEIERDLRDAIGGVLYGGTSDIQRNIIARLAGL